MKTFASVFLTGVIALFAAPVATLAASDSAVHPNLWFSKRDLPAVQAKLKDPRLAELWDRVKDAALRPPKDFDIRGMQAAGLAYNLTGDTKYARPAIQIALKIARDKSWPTRQGIGHGKIKWAGLETGTNCKVLGSAYDLLYHAMSADERRTIREALVNRVWPKYLAAFHAESPKGWPVDADGHFEWWTNTYANWASWLTGGVGVSALALYDEEPMAKQVLEKVKRGFKNQYRAFSQKTEDGGWDEGPMYWSTTFSHALYFHAALERVTGSDNGFFKLPGIALTGHFRIDFTAPDGRLVAFNDCNFITPSFVAAEFFLAATRYKRPEYIWYADTHCPKWYEQAFALLWRPAGPTPSAPPPAPLRWYRDVNWAVMRTANLYVPFKGGDLGVGHGQLDAGNFLIYAGGERLLNDPGYGKKDTAVHNTLLVDGQGQKRRGGFSGGEPSEANAPIEKVLLNAHERYLVCNVTACYNGALTSWRRHVLTTTRDQVIIFDEMSASKPKSYTLNFHSDQQVRADSGFENGATMKGATAGLRVTTLGEGGSKNKVAKSGAGTAFSASSSGPRASWRAFTVFATAPTGLPASPSVEAEFTTTGATLKVGGESFSFTLQGDRHVFQSAHGSTQPDLAGICAGVGGSGSGSVLTSTLARPARPSASATANGAAQVRAAPPKTAAPQVDAATLKPWALKLKARILAGVKAGQRPKTYLHLFGAKPEAVRVLKASDNDLTVDMKGNKLPMQWSQLKRADHLNLARAFCTADDPQDELLLAVFLFAEGKVDDAEELFAKIITANPAAHREMVESARASLVGK